MLVLCPCPEPDDKSQAEARFTTRPHAATTSIGVPRISAGSRQRETASTMTHSAVTPSDDAVGQGREGLGPPVAVRAQDGARAGRDPLGHDRERQSSGVGQHVAGVGDQRETVNEPPGHRLDDHESRGETSSAEEQPSAVIRGRDDDLGDRAARGA